MKIAVYIWKNRPFSIARYTDAIASALGDLGVDLVSFGESDPVPDAADLYWDPGTGRPGPHFRLRDVAGPVAVTYHGAANLSLPVRDCYGPGMIAYLRAARARWTTRRQWQSFSGRPLHTIAVSEYAKMEAVTHLALNPDDVTAVYHGVAASDFAPAPSTTTGRKPYFLHVSVFQPKKNVEAVIKAYRRLQLDEGSELILICPGYRADALPDGVRLITTAASAATLAEMYSAAIAFVFPSLHETFGMPILEAMACGCPVITSNVTACPEVAGDAALLVKPRSVSELADAMRRLFEDSSLRADLRQRGLARARQLTWQRSAEQHLEVFKDVVRQGKCK